MFEWLAYYTHPVDIGAKTVASLESLNTRTTSLGVDTDGLTFTGISTNDRGSETASIEVEMNLVPVPVDYPNSFQKHPLLGSDHNITTLC